MFIPRESKEIHLILPALKKQFIKWQDENSFKCKKNNDILAACCKKNLELNEHFFGKIKCDISIIDAPCQNWIRRNVKLEKQKKQHCFNWQEITSMLETGLTVSEIAKLIDTSHQLLRYHIKKKGLK